MTAGTSTFDGQHWLKFSKIEDMVKIRLAKFLRPSRRAYVECFFARAEIMTGTIGRSHVVLDVAGRIAVGKERED